MRICGNLIFRAGKFGVIAMNYLSDGKTSERFCQSRRFVLDFADISAGKNNNVKLGWRTIARFSLSLL